MCNKNKHIHNNKKQIASKKKSFGFSPPNLLCIMFLICKMNAKKRKMDQKERENIF